MRTIEQRYIEQSFDIIDKTSLDIEISILSITCTKNTAKASHYFLSKTLIFPCSSYSQAFTSL